MYTLGIDIGSTTSKCIILEDGERIVGSSLVVGGMGTKGPAQAVEDVLADASLTREDMQGIVATGYGRNKCTETDQQASELTERNVIVLPTKSVPMGISAALAFDPAVYPLMRLWGFAGKEGEERTPAKPEDEEIQALLPLCRPENVVLRPENHALEVTVPGTMLDLGGAVKGYASARLMELFREQGVSSALVNLGGNVQVLGTKPDGSLWRIGIEDPEREGNIAALSLTDTAAVTSGGYERGFEEDGRRYHHLLDPETGYPAEGGLLSVTVLTPDGALADMLSTALFVMGRERAEAFVARRAADWQFEAVLVTEDRELLATEGLRDRLESRESVAFIAQIR